MLQSVKGTENELFSQYYQMMKGYYNIFNPRPVALKFFMQDQITNFNTTQNPNLVAGKWTLMKMKDSFVQVKNFYFRFTSSGGTSGHISR